MCVVTMAFAVLGFLSPSNRGGLMTALLLLFVLMGALAGYVSAVMYKGFRGTEWRLTTLKTALMFPGIVAIIFFTLNLFIWGEKSSGAVPFTLMTSDCLPHQEKSSGAVPFTTCSRCSDCLPHQVLLTLMTSDCLPHQVPCHSPPCSRCSACGLGCPCPSWASAPILGTSARCLGP